MAAQNPLEICVGIEAVVLIRTEFSKFTSAKQEWGNEKLKDIENRKKKYTINKNIDHKKTKILAIADLEEMELDRKLFVSRNQK